MRRAAAIASFSRPAIIARRLAAVRPGVLLCLAGLLLPGRVGGQPSAPLLLSPELAITQHIHETWQVEDGLPQSIVNDVLQTQDGYLWLGTQEGLVRFDGVAFTVFDRAHTPAENVVMNCVAPGSAPITTTPGRLISSLSC